MLIILAKLKVTYVCKVPRSSMYRRPNKYLPIAGPGRSGRVRILAETVPGREGEPCLTAHLGLVSPTEITPKMGLVTPKMG